MEKLKSWKEKIAQKLEKDPRAQKLKKYWEESLINKLLVLVIISWIALAIIFGFADLQISIAVVDEHSKLGKFGEDFGEAPGYGLISIAVAILCAVAVSKRAPELKKQKLPGFIIAIGALVLMIVGLILYALDMSAQLAIISGSIAISLFLFIAFTYKKDWTKYKTMAIVIALLSIINPLLFVQITKQIWGRVRFRDLSRNYSNYTPWIVPRGFTGNESFPSGHAAMGWMFLPLLFLISDREKVLKKDTNFILAVVLFLAVILWGLFVDISRVVIGAHYASDVLCSTGMAIVLTILLYKRFYIAEQTGREPKIKEPKRFRAEKEEKPEKLEKIKKRKVKKEKRETPEETKAEIRRKMKEELRAKMGFDEFDEDESETKYDFDEEKDDKKKRHDELDDEFPLEE